MPSPLYLRYHWVPGEWMKDGAPVEVTYIPSSWTSKLVSEAFWNDRTIPQKSANFFHRPNVFTTTTPYNIGDPWHAVDPDPDDDTLVAMTDSDTAALDTWNERYELWENIRSGWHEFEKFKWDKSPWGLVEWRVKIDRFTVAFAQRDEVTCARIATNLTHCINWSVDRALYLKYLPRSGRDTSPWWAIHCIVGNLLRIKSGLLMMASMPIRTQKITKISSVADKPVTFTATPSRKAAAAGQISTVYINMPVREEKPFDIDKSLFYNQVRETGEKVDGITQMDYLGLISDVLREITLYAPMHAMWLGSIMAAQAKLHTDRRTIRTEYSGAHITRWSSKWFFEIPEYSQHIIRVANDKQYDMNWNRDTETLEYGQEGRVGDGWAHMIPRP
ncbi:hypothetical protein ANO14919_028630 [Xylariales sp. No.14919]|nr:hypothetical protein ANO14919_028630 [Xylariales sp. No.14919]